MTKILLALLAGFLIIGCSDQGNKKDDYQKTNTEALTGNTEVPTGNTEVPTGNTAAVFVDTNIYIKYVNEKGENLLEIADSIKESDITVYHKIDGEWKLYFEDNLDYPKGIRTMKIDEENFLVIFPSTTIVKDNYSETKIEFSDGKSHVIKTEIDKKGSSTVVTKVWYDGELKWEGNGVERVFEIVK